MSKFVVYVLDKIVWMLLITVLATQALQIAGIVDSPKTLGDISYAQANEYNYQVSVGNGDVRGKRHADERSAFIDSLFNITSRYASCMIMRRYIVSQPKRPEMLSMLHIRSAMNRIFQIIVDRMYNKNCQKFNNTIPISTLNAVNNLVQSSRPAFQKLREYAVKRFEKTTKSPDFASNNSNQTVVRQQRAYPIFFRSNKEDEAKV